MINYSYGSFTIQSAVMKNVLDELHRNTDKNFFIIVGEAGTGKTTMLNYVNKIVFKNMQKNTFDESLDFKPEMTSAIVTTTKDFAYEVLRKFDKNQTHIIEMPVLNERKADIIAFSQFFIQVLSLMNNKQSFKLTDKASEKLLQYNWPGHFHELESVIEKAFENCESLNSVEGARFCIEPEHINLSLQTKELEFSIGQKLDEVERKYILQTLYFVHQNRTKAAEILGISIRTLRNKINLYREEGYL